MEFLVSAARPAAKLNLRGLIAHSSRQDVGVKGRRRRPAKRAFALDAHVLPRHPNVQHPKVSSLNQHVINYCPIDGAHGIFAGAKLSEIFRLHSRCSLRS
jgi:hypothetical protein